MCQINLSFLFNPQMPYESIAQFTNRQLLLPEKAQVAFINTVENFFEKKAYLDENLPATDAVKRQFVTWDVPNLATIAVGGWWNNGLFRALKLVANISKVAQVALDQLETVGVYQVICSSSGKYWGWIPATLVKDSLLEHHIQHGKLVLKDDEVSLLKYPMKC